MATVKASLSQESLLETAKKIQQIEELVDSNVRNATQAFMMSSYQNMVEIFNRSNLSNHVKEIKYELIDGGYGFKIYTEDWVVFFNEYGTGKFNINGMKTTKLPWRYFKDGSFHTTFGQRPKGMFALLRDVINANGKGIYQTAINYAINQTSYEQFASIADGSIRL